MKKLLALLLSLALLTIFAGPTLAEAQAAEDTFETYICPAIFATGEETFMTEELEVAFLNGDTSVPYMSIDYYYDFINEFMQSFAGYTGYSVETRHIDGDLYVLRDNESFLYFTPDGEVLISDCDLFVAAGGAKYANELDEIQPLMDETGTPLTDEEGNYYVKYLTRVDDGSSFARSGSALGADLNQYNLKLYVDGDNFYLPVAVLNNLFNPGCPLSIVYNGEYLFLLLSGTLNYVATDENGLTQADYYYNYKTSERSDALTELTYNLLCCELDLNYGLKSAHNIPDDFSEYLATIGLEERMLQNDGAAFFDALLDLVYSYFADFHSGVNNIGPYVDTSKVSGGTLGQPASTAYYDDASLKFAEARRQAGLTSMTDDGVEYISEPYSEVGDTAYITFDSFQYADINFYDDTMIDYLPDCIGTDTVALVIYANQMINREDSPIKNVVIDLSNNGGGSVFSALYLMSWVMGNAQYCVTNPISGSQCSVMYKADVDLDGVITEADALDLSKLNVYCLTSLVSFSCGNLVPASFKTSGKVTILGQTSGGGACAVQTSITADGVFFQYSSNDRFSTVKNGSFYSVDEGVVPNFYISKPEHFYDREWLNDFIANLP